MQKIVFGKKNCIKGCKNCNWAVVYSGRIPLPVEKTLKKNIWSIVFYRQFDQNFERVKRNVSIWYQNVLFLKEWYVVDIPIEQCSLLSTETQMLLSKLLGNVQLKALNGYGTYLTIADDAFRTAILPHISVQSPDTRRIARQSPDTRRIARQSPDTRRIAGQA